MVSNITCFMAFCAVIIVQFTVHSLLAALGAAPDAPRDAEGDIVMEHDDEIEDDLREKSENEDSLGVKTSNLPEHPESTDEEEDIGPDENTSLVSSDLSGTVDGRTYQHPLIAQLPIDNDQSAVSDDAHPGSLDPASVRLKLLAYQNTTDMPQSAGKSALSRLGQSNMLRSFATASQTVSGTIISSRPPLVLHSLTHSFWSVVPLRRYSFLMWTSFSLKSLLSVCWTAFVLIPLFTRQLKI